MVLVFKPPYLCSTLISENDLLSIHSLILSYFWISQKNFKEKIYKNFESLTKLQKKNICHKIVDKESNLKNRSIKLALQLPAKTILFLDAFSHLYKRVCPSVRPSVGRSVRPSVRRWVTFFNFKRF